MAKLMRNTLKIPVVVMGAVSENLRLLQLLPKCAASYGFFYLTGRGIAPQNIA
jgi:hypothetical protein